ncbi:hypothetical protein [Mesorhizobium sp. M2A.F.Ca.ET.067.02.1.1]|uniref:hypothetical protein n=1 Tax=Mesorhizobium sp. M2A.F.Ca.ET.067.02.1.1 TaxID=2496749 RepID=UPI001FDFFAE7|nr:hypothetical protein [Mesorhizobium sp. M2A.F.Ca.ET.067.02.1.1]
MDDENQRAARAKKGSPFLKTAQPPSILGLPSALPHARWPTLRSQGDSRRQGWDSMRSDNSRP